MICSKVRQPHSIKQRPRDMRLKEVFHVSYKLQPRGRAAPPRRKFNKLVANPVFEDYSLRYAPKSFRTWSQYAVFSAALGGIAYLADQAIGGSLAVQFGFENAFWGILAAAVIIFLTGIPIAYYCAKYNVDVDLLTRGAGFGYLGSTITSVIYASFTFIFFALEGSIMAQAFNLYFGIPLWIGYALGAFMIIPLVTFGMTLLSKLQVWTQPIWLTLLFAPPIAVLATDPHAISNWTSFAGSSPSGSHFNPLLFGAAAGIALSLIAQIGEQADYLRFMPDKTKKNSFGWWLAVLGAGPGWVILGAAKQLMGSFFASLAFTHGTPLAKANEPIQMYHTGFTYIFGAGMVAVSVATFFVILSQIKINVTNAYSGSLSWSNFFSRIFHAPSGPGGLYLLQCRDFADLDGTEYVLVPWAYSWLLLERRGCLDRRGHGRSRHQQTAAQAQPVLCRVQAGASVQLQSGRLRRDGDRLAHLRAGVLRCLRRLRAGLLRLHRARRVVHPLARSSPSRPKANTTSPAIRTTMPACITAR